VAFDLAFGFFAVAMVAIAVLAIRWAVGRDRAAKRLKDASGDRDQSGDRNQSGDRTN